MVLFQIFSFIHKVTLAINVQNKKDRLILKSVQWTDFIYELNLYAGNICIYTEFQQIVRP